MKKLNKHDIQTISGGFWPVIALVARVAAPSILNMAIYSYRKHHNKEEIRPQGLAIAGGAGLLSGGVGAAAGAAAGGTLIGNAVWLPTTAAINATGNLIAQEH